MDATLELACSNYRSYIEAIFKPATDHFLHLLNSDGVKLHQVFGTNLFVAHAVDYIQAIRKADGISETRKDLVKNFDVYFSVDGGRFQNRKFELIDGVNNALKHIQLDNKRYPELAKEYGKIAFSCLIQDKSQVLCILEGYRFDYSRAVLRPAIRALSGWHFEDLESIRSFALGGNAFESLPLEVDDTDPIDQMIAYANPVCDDCGEPSDSCVCETYVFNGENGSFTSNFSDSFDFDAVMSRISGAYRRER